LAKGTPDMEARRHYRRMVWFICLAVVTASTLISPLPDDIVDENSQDADAIHGLLSGVQVSADPVPAAAPAAAAPAATPADSTAAPAPPAVDSVAQAKQQAKAQQIKAKADAQQQKLKSQADQKAKKLDDARREKKVKAENEAHVDKMTKLKNELAVKKVKAQQELDLKAKKQLADAKIQAEKSNKALLIMQKKAQLKLDYEQRLHLAQQKVDEELDAKKAAKKKVAQEKQDKVFKVSKVKESLEKHASWMKERSNKRVARIRFRALGDRIRVRERTKKARLLAKNPMDVFLRERERKASRNLRYQNKDFARTARRDFRLRKYMIRHKRKEVVQHVRKQEELDAKVEKKYALKFGIKIQPGVHFKPFAGDKDWEKKVEGVAGKLKLEQDSKDDTAKYVPVALATHEMVKDSRDAFEYGKAQHVASEAVADALKDLDPSPSHTDGGY